MIFKGLGGQKNVGCSLPTIPQMECRSCNDSCGRLVVIIREQFDSENAASLVHDGLSAVKEANNQENDDHEHPSTPQLTM